MKVVTGHLTATNKAHIKHLLGINVLSAKIGRINYHITRGPDAYNVNMVVKDRGLIPCPGSALRDRTTSATFTI